MPDGDDVALMLTGLMLGVALTLGAFAIRDAHRRQWHVRTLRQIRALPEHRPHLRQEKP